MSKITEEALNAFKEIKESIVSVGGNNTPLLNLLSIMISEFETGVVNDDLFSVIHSGMSNLKDTLQVTVCASQILDMCIGYYKPIELTTHAQRRVAIEHSSLGLFHSLVMKGDSDKHELTELITNSVPMAYDMLVEHLLRSNTAISDSQLTYEGKPKTK